MKRGYRMLINPKEYRIKCGAYWVVDLNDIKDKNKFINFDEDESRACTFIGKFDSIKKLVDEYNNAIGSSLCIVTETGKNVTAETEEENKHNNIPDFDLDAIRHVVREISSLQSSLSVLETEMKKLESEKTKNNGEYVLFMDSSTYNVKYETAWTIGNTIAKDLNLKLQAAKRRLSELTSLRLK